MKIIDAHTHIYPDAIARKATDSICDFYDLGSYAVATTETLLAFGAKIGVERYLVCSCATTPGHVRSINDFIARQCKEHDCFVGLAALHPDTVDYEAELDRSIALGLKGVKYHSDFQEFDIDDAKMIPVYRAIAKRGLPVLFHMGDERYEYSRPFRLRNACEQVPEMTAIAAHLGGYQRWDEAYSMPLMGNIYYDTSSALRFLGPEKSRRMIEKFGADRFMFGTDFPMGDAETELKLFMELGFDEETNRKILHDNFVTLFGEV